MYHNIWQAKQLGIIIWQVDLSIINVDLSYLYVVLSNPYVDLSGKIWWKLDIYQTLGLYTLCIQFLGNKYQVDIQIWQVVAELCHYALEFKSGHDCIISAIFYHGIKYWLLLIQQICWKSKTSAINNFNVIIMD